MIEMVNEYEGFFRACFPGIERGRSTVLQILSQPKNRFFFRKAADQTVGLAVMQDNVVLMFGVLPAFRGRGIGTDLLRELEETVRADGWDELRFCGGSVYLAPGIPIGRGYENNAAFFSRRGYIHEWGEDECVDMDLDLTKSLELPVSPGDSLNGILYRLAEEKDRKAVLDCAEDGHPKFVPYYDRPDAYLPDSGRRVLVAVADNRVVGALTLFDERATETPGLGSVGGTVVRCAERGRGIATAMVQAGTSYLRSIGMKRAFLGYTYTAIVPMYARSGYEICMRYMMAVKSLR